MNVGQVLALYVVVATAVPCYVYYAVHGALGGLQVCLTFFCILNLLICVWELCLCYKCHVVERDYAKLRERWPATPRGRLGALGELFFAPVTLSNVASPAFWSKIWSTYALYDPSYADGQSWGFWVDVGNGHTTLLPSLLWIVCSIYPVLPPRTLGLLSLISFFLEFYGTVIYFASFVHNKRYRGKTKLEVALFVGLSNGIWLIGPLAGCKVALDLIYDDSYAALHAP